MAKGTKETTGAEAAPVVTPQTLEDALIVIANQEATIAKQVATISEQAELIDELEKELSAKDSIIAQFKTGVPVFPEVTIDGKTYVVNSGTLFNGKKYTREELAEDAKACEGILAITGQQTLTEKEAE